jgi:sec-independent protein translocase protein TatA
MIGDLFDSPWKILIVAAVILVLFGSAKLPVAARSLGKSMRILKTEVQGLHEDDAAVPAAPAQFQAPIPPAAPAAAAVAPAAAPDAQAQIDALSRQLDELKQKQPVNATDVTQAQ